MLASQHIYRKKKKKKKKQCGNHKATKTYKEYGGGGVVVCVCVWMLKANFTLGPDATLNTEIHKISVPIKAIHQSENTKNQINHYDKQR